VNYREENEGSVQHKVFSYYCKSSCQEIRHFTALLYSAAKIYRNTLGEAIVVLKEQVITKK